MAVTPVPLHEPSRRMSWQVINDLANSRSESIPDFLAKCTSLESLKLTKSPPVNNELFQEILEKVREHKQLKELSLKKARVESTALKGFLNISSLKISHCNHLVSIEITECHGLTRLQLKKLPALVNLTIFKCWFLETIDLSDKRFPLLQNLSVQQCTLLKSLNISDLQTLKVISVYHNGNCLLIGTNVLTGTSPKPSPKQSPKEKM